MTELLPCPFCWSDDVHITGAYPHYVYCLSCGMMTQLAGKAWEKDIPELKKSVEHTHIKRKRCGEVNLYMVLDSNYDWCCFAFDTSRNKAKLRVAREFGNEYTEMRCKTLKKGVNVPVPMLVTHPDDNGYDIVKNCGYEYGTDDI